MKKIICFFIAIVCIATNINAQSKALKQYYYWINQAELAICDSNYQKASDDYDKAFSFHRPFGHHLLSAFRVNYDYLNNFERSLDCYRYLAQMGDEPEWYVDDTLKEAEFFKQLKIIFNTTQRHINPDLAAAFEEICESDQAGRWKLFDNPEDYDAYFRGVDSLNLIRIQNLYKTYSEISDYTLGCSPLKCSAFYTHVSRGFLFDPKTILLKDVRRGILPADQYASSEDSWKCIYINPALGIKKNTIYGTNINCIFSIDSVVFFVEPDNVKKIDKARKRIGLSETWADFVKKAKYVYTHDTEFHFMPRSSICYSPEETSIKMSQWLQDLTDGTRKGFYLITPKELRR